MLNPLVFHWDSSIRSKFSWNAMGDFFFSASIYFLLVRTRVKLAILNWEVGQNCLEKMFSKFNKNRTNRKRNLKFVCFYFYSFQFFFKDSIKFTSFKIKHAIYKIQEFTLIQRFWVFLLWISYKFTSDVFYSWFNTILVFIYSLIINIHLKKVYHSFLT